MKEELEAFLDYYLKPKLKNKIEMMFSQNAEAGMGYYEEDVASFIRENKEDDTFQTKLLKWIDEKSLKDSDVYNKVNIDRRLFSKIRSNKNYHPSKETIILLGIALELSENEIEELLDSASYSLPLNNKFDLIIRFCFREKIYNLFQINEFLEEHHCKVLG